ncbi:YncE family protein [Mycolicibacterium sp. CH28]|uniref:Ig-like domain-containing protein n=1 Tax=Mycolicibacterium sp. CH28 TaxID=2512237 RepID=UPI001080E485|nr:Ig-like domain-containing protein [Mycolicibacterium sp. CH28]TGD85651.1 YncE family protein [Mycolicibacterium sp. CH28]
MSCSSYVGRVGALAVTLGVGVAMANGPVAWADDSTAGGSAAHASTGSSGVRAHRESSAGPRARTKPGAASATDGGTDVSDVDAPASRRVGSLTRVVGQQIRSGDPGPVAGVGSAKRATTVSVPVAAADAPAATAIATPDSVVGSATVPAKAVSAPQTIPQLPFDFSTLLGALDSARRQIVGLVFNRAPVTHALQIGENAKSEVVGVLGAVDPDGDPLTYNVTQGPKYGEVVVGADGTYTYTPGVALAANGGQDSFTVEVRDVGIRLLSQPGSSSVTVAVTVGGGDALGIGGTPYGVAMSVDGTRAYVTDTANNRVSVIDIAKQAVVSSIAVGKSPWGIAVGPDGRAYVVNSSDGTVSVIDTTGNTVLGNLYVGNSPTSVAVNTDGSKVYVTNTNDDTVAAIDTTTFKRTYIKVGDNPFGVAVAGNKVFVTNEYDDTVSVIDTATNTVIATVAVGDHPTGIAAGGGRVVVANAGSSTVDGDGSVSVIDAGTLAVIGSQISVGDFPTNVVLDADGTRAYVTDFNMGTVSVVDLQTGSLVGSPISVNNVAEGAAGIAIGADGKLYVAGAVDGSVDPITLDSPAVGSFQPVAAVVERPSAAAQSAAIAAANATPAGPNSGVTTKAFKVYNLTSSSVTLVRYEGEDRPLNGFPPAGTVIAPGGSLDVLVPEPNWLAQNNIKIVLANTAGTTWTAYLRYDRTINTSYLVKGEVRGAGDVTPQAKFLGIRRYSLGDQVTLLESPGTNSTITSPTKDQTTLMNTLCTSGGVSCQFTAKGAAVQTWTEYRPPQTANGVSSVLNNGSSVAQKRIIKYSVTESSKTTTEFSSKLNITFVKDVIGLELAAKYGTELTASKTWEDTYEINAAPYKQVSLLIKAPIWQVTGDLVINFGNTTITMKNVTLTNPDQTRSPEADIRETDCTNCTIPKPTTPSATAVPAPGGTVVVGRPAEELV